MASARGNTLRDSTHAFCKALVSPPAPSDLLTTHFNSSPKITEHGPSWATKALPFLGKTFSGRNGCEEYFRLMTSTLSMELSSEAFPSKQEFIVDADSAMVSVVGKGHFTSKKTGKGWDEQFIYRFSEFDGEGKLGHWEIWADPLSAWEAVTSGQKGSASEENVHDESGEQTLAQKYVEEISPEGVRM